MKNKFLGSMIILFFVCLFAPLSADVPWLEDNIANSPVFEGAQCYYLQGFYKSTHDELQKIVEQYPNTIYEANAHIFLGDIYSQLSKNEQSRQEYQTLVDKFPNTRYWLIGRFMIIFSSRPTDKKWIDNINELIMSVGGKNTYDILNGDTGNISTISSEYRYTLAGIYYWIATDLHIIYPNNYLVGEHRLLTFIRENFPKYNDYDILGMIRDDIIDSNDSINFSNFQKDTSPPQITIDSPHHGNRVHGLKPRIQVALQDGDIMAAQVNLSKLIFTLDGEDVTDKMKVHNAINTSAQPGVIFEKIKIVYKPESPLAVGSHTVYVKAEDCGGRSSEKTWTFTIVKPELYRDGDDEDN